MTDIILVLVIVAIVGGAILYIRKEKKRGVRCVGCPDGGVCGGNCSGCGGGNGADAENGGNGCSCSGDSQKK